MKNDNSLKRNVNRLFYLIVVFMLAFFLQFQNTVYSQADNDGTGMSSPKQVEIAGTQVLHIKSVIVDQDYDLYINLPANYDNDKSKTYPVIYLLDAQWDFPLLNAIYGSQYYDGFIPGLIVVGITWGGKNPNPDLLRARDFTPTSISSQANLSGGAKKFISFIREELISFIDSKFRTTKNERTLMGSSLGGLFTLYALFNDTDLFNHYVLTSPAVSWDNGVLFNDEKSYAEKNSNLPVRVFMGIGEYEDPTYYQKFVDQVKSHNYTGLQFESKVLEGVGHSGGKAEGYPHGLQFVFAKPSLTLDDNILEQYAGEYEIMKGFNAKISVDNGKLVVQIPGQKKIVMNAESESDFYVTGYFLMLHFQKDTAGKVIGFQLEQYQSKRFVKKAD